MAIKKQKVKLTDLHVKLNKPYEYMPGHFLPVGEYVEVDRETKKKLKEEGYLDEPEKENVLDTEKVSEEESKENYKPKRKK